jgi:hypothetical protein
MPEARKAKPSSGTFRRVWDRHSAGKIEYHRVPLAYNTLQSGGLSGPIIVFRKPLAIALVLGYAAS